MTPLLSLINSETPVRFLAVVGAAAVGALAFSFLLRIGSGFVYRQKLPNWATWGVRLLGGGACGFVAYLILFGGGGGGLGGPGGPGVGSGTSSNRDKDEPGTKKTRKDDKSKSDDPPATEAERLVVEVLGDAPLEKIAAAEKLAATKKAKIDTEARYRVAGQTGLMTLKDLQKHILSRRDRTPPLRQLVIELYKDSPSDRSSQVTSLVKWAEVDEAGKRWLQVDVSVKDRYAPWE